MLKVAVDSGPLTSGDSVRGIGVYTKELLKALKMRGVDVENTDLGSYDIVHFTKFHTFFISLPFSKPKNVKFILTVYDLIPLIYSDHYPPGIRGWLKWQINKWLIRKNVDAIITISETSKKDICRFIGIDPSKVFVTYLAASSVFKKMESGKLEVEIKKRYGLPNRFAMYVGDLNYNKNIPNLIKACNLAKIPLVIAGKQSTEFEKQDLNHPELRHLNKLDWSNVFRLGYVPEADLAKIYNLATVYVQASVYEGFGIPLLEALACKTPLAVSKNQCHVEILGSDFVYFNPSDPEEMAKKILSPNVNKTLPRVYSWSRTAEQTLKIYDQVFS